MSAAGCHCFDFVKISVHVAVFFSGRCTKEESYNMPYAWPWTINPKSLTRVQEGKVGQNRYLGAKSDMFVSELRAK